MRSSFCISDILLCFFTKSLTRSIRCLNIPVSFTIDFSAPLLFKALKRENLETFEDPCFGLLGGLRLTPFGLSFLVGAGLVLGLEPGLTRTGMPRFEVGDSPLEGDVL